MTARRFSGAFALLTMLSACVAPPPRPYPASRGQVSMDEEIAAEHAKLRGRAEASYREQKRRVERVGSRLLETIPGKPQVQFVIVNGDPSINAGATFGQVAITSGMLKFIQTDD